MTKEVEVRQALEQIRNCGLNNCANTIQAHIEKLSADNRKWLKETVRGLLGAIDEMRAYISNPQDVAWNNVLHQAAAVKRATMDEDRKRELLLEIKPLVSTKAYNELYGMLYASQEREEP